jgi:hypothetical protein
MIYLLAIFFGVFLGLILSKIGSHRNILSYVVLILPYTIFFWLSLENRDLWGIYRIAAIIATFIAIGVWKVKEVYEK